MNGIGLRFFIFLQSKLVTLIEDPILKHNQGYVKYSKHAKYVE